MASVHESQALRGSDSLQEHGNSMAATAKNHVICEKNTLAAHYKVALGEAKDQPKTDTVTEPFFPGAFLELYSRII